MNMSKGLKNSKIDQRVVKQTEQTGEVAPADVCRY